MPGTRLSLTSQAILYYIPMLPDPISTTPSSHRKGTVPLRLHDSPPRPSQRSPALPVLVPQQMRGCLRKHVAHSFIRSVQCLLIAGKVVEHAFCYDEDVFGEVEGGGDY